MYYNLLIIFILGIFTNGMLIRNAGSHQVIEGQDVMEKMVLPGAHQLMQRLEDLESKRVSLVVNQTSLVGDMHLVDTLLSRGVVIERIFSPEHGFRGDADAGAHIADARDPTSGIPIISLYGEKRKPSHNDLESSDVVIFDIQDVGARFYTYISTLHYVMEACAEYGKPLWVLDRPNPNGNYVDGPIREEKYKSFVGMHPVPVVYGMTIGEYARMINGEGWLQDGHQCDLTVIPCTDYNHQTMYELPVAPSPNLPNLRSILLYPSLCFFEGTPLSIGRGTRKQFQVIGHPDVPEDNYTFTPMPMFGAAHPKLEGQECHGVDLSMQDVDQLFAVGQIELDYVLRYYQLFPDKDQFFNENLWFDKLAGTATLREQVQAGKSEEEIRASWKADLESFKEIREKYLLYE